MAMIMSQNVFSLFFVISFLITRLVLSNTNGPCNANSPVVKFCQNNSASASTVYLDTSGAPSFEANTCTCILTIDKFNTTTYVNGTAIRKAPSGIDLFINNEKFNTSASAVNIFSYSSAMTIKFVISASERNSQCYEFGNSNPAGENLTIICSVQSTTTETTSTTDGNSATTQGITQPTLNDSTTDGLQESGNSTTDGLQESVVNETNTSVIAGASSCAFIIIVLAVILVVIVCKKRRASTRTQRNGEKLDSVSKNPAYDMTVNAGYISADDCQRENAHNTEHDPRGYALINKSRSAQKFTPHSESSEDDYNHLNGVLYTRTPENVYNTMASADIADDTDTDDYNRINEVKKKKETDHVYNVTGLNNSCDNMYNRTKITVPSVPTNNMYGTRKTNI